LVLSSVKAKATDIKLKLSLNLNYSIKAKITALFENSLTKWNVSLTTSVLLDTPSKL